MCHYGVECRMTQPHEAGQPADTKAAAEATGATSLFELYQRLDDALHQGNACREYDACVCPVDVYSRK